MVKKLCSHTVTTGMNIAISQNYSVQCAHLENTEILCNQPPSRNILHVDRDAGYVCIRAGVIPALESPPDLDFVSFLSPMKVIPAPAHFHLNRLQP